MNKVDIKLENIDLNLTYVGDLYLINGDVYILACVEYDKYVLISLADGSRYDDIFECDDVLTIDKVIDEIKINDDNFNISDVKYIGNKNIIIKD